VDSAFEPDVFLVHSGEAAETAAWKVAERLRDAGLTVVLGQGGSFKSQMKKADASGARFAILVGDDEVASRQVAVKSLRAGGEQRTVAVEQAIALIS
jgi:histidyl-tRNA synthetase